MHLCYLCDEYPPGSHGGIGTLTQTLARAMARRGHRVTVVGIYRVAAAVEESDQGVRVVRLPHSTLPWTGFVVHGWRLRKTLRAIDRETPIDLIEGSELSFALLPRRLRMRKVIRISGGHHFFARTLGRKPAPWRSWLERRSFARADFFCALSEFAARTTRELLHMGSRPIEVLPSPVNVEEFRPSEPRPERGLIVFLGTLCDKKGVRELTLAFRQVLRSLPQARLRLVGRDSRDPATGGSYADMIRSLLLPAELARVEFTGHLDRAAVRDVLARAEVAVFPSHMETQGLVILEAMASGKAVVTTRTGPGPELVEDGVSGILCDPHDPASIAAALLRVLDDGGLRERLAEAARARVVALFSEDALMGRTEAFYARCVESRAAAWSAASAQASRHA
jgi:glycosyltransferase involved in cell wall biosynthesis